MRRFDRWPRRLTVAASLVVFAPRVLATGDGAANGVEAAESGALRLEAPRSVRFRVSGGTWMSLDVSPDGQTILFDLLGALYTLPIAGGTATRITHGPAVNRQPRYSPDGRYIAFISDANGNDNLWMADRDGQGARELSSLDGDVLGAVSSPAWSPDGRTIVASQRLRPSRPGVLSVGQATRWLLVAYDVQTRSMRWVSDTAPDRVRSVIGATFGVDHRTVYAAVGAPVPEVNDFEDWQIARVDLATGRIRPELWLGSGRVSMRPAVSRDGRWLAYVSIAGTHPGLRVRDLQTDREHWVVREALDDPPVAQSNLSGDLIPGYAFTPDSRAIIMGYGGKIRRLDIVSGRVTVIPFVADVERELGPLTIQQFSLPDTAVRTRSIMQPALSPDGTHVAFSALDRIWVMELPHDGVPAGQPRRLTVDSVGEFYPSWSPDGRWIAYSTWQDGEGGTVRRVAVGRSPAPSSRLTADTALYFHTAVAPDGTRIVAVRASVSPDRMLTPRIHTDEHGWPIAALDPRLVWLPVSGGKPRAIASLTDQQHAAPRYPVDQLYFTSDPNRIYVGLTSWSWDGTNRRASLTASADHSTENTWERADFVGVLASDQRRCLVKYLSTLIELSLPALPVRRSPAPDTFDLGRALTANFGASDGSARAWGPALEPWISWSRDGRRVSFGQGGTLFLGDVRPDAWIAFTPVDVLLMVPVDVAPGSLLLRGARLITMRGTEVIEGGDLLVQNSRIAAVGPRGRVPIPADTEVLDVTDATILPGYVDLHDHLPLPRGVHGTQCWACLATLAYGVTAIRNPNSLGADIFAYRERERTGDLLAPRLFSTGTAWYGNGPPIHTLDDARNIVRPYAQYLDSESFKVYPVSAGRATRQMLAIALRESKLNATVHAELQLALTVAIDGFAGNEHTHTIRLYDDVAAFFASSGTTYTQTYGADIGGAWDYLFRRHGGIWENAKMRRFVPASARASIEPEASGTMDVDNLIPVLSGSARIAAKGGRVGMGSHGNIPGLGYHYEMWLHALGGMSNHDILRSATSVGAAAIGHVRDFGSLEPGKLADLQILDRNPLEDIHQTVSIRYVMKNGRLFLADDLTEVWPRHRAVDSAYVRQDSEPHTPPASAPRVSRPSK
ncbi:MAG: amidohydrolase family protein [Gemmatimonadales bacterium]